MPHQRVTTQPTLRLNHPTGDNQPSRARNPIDENQRPPENDFRSLPNPILRVISVRQPKGARGRTGSIRARREVGEVEEEEDRTGKQGNYLYK